jgi:transposase
LTKCCIVYIIYTMSFIRKIKKGNQVYLAEVENVRVEGKVIQRHIRYVGKEVDNKPMLTGSVASSTVDRVTIFGPLLILDEIAKQIGLAEHLGGYGNYLLSLAYAHCVAPDSLAGIVEWYQKSEIGNLLPIADVSYKKLIEAIDSVEGHSADTQSKIFENIKEALKLSTRGYFYDITDVYFYGLCCPLAKPGHNAEGRKERQIQVGLAVTQEEGIPILHKVFEGNIFDAKTLPDILLSLKEQNMQGICLVWDRGVSSMLNIQETKGMGFEVLCGLPLKAGLKKVVDQILDEEMVSLKHRVRLTQTTFYVKKIKYRSEETDGYLAICLNEKEKQAIRERRYDEIDQALQQLKEKKGIKEGLLKYISGGKIDYPAVTLAERYDGISVIFSTRDLSTEEIVKGYFEKDKVEKSFRCLKGLIEMDRVRFWLANRVRGHIFVCYLAYVLLSVLEYKLRKIGIKAAEALETLESVYRVYLSDPKSQNKFVKTVTLSKKQEEILMEINPLLLKKCSV